MDYLIEIKDKVKADLYNETVNLFNREVEVIFKDLASNYFEGDGPQLAQWGYSRTGVQIGSSWFWAWG